MTTLPPDTSRSSTARSTGDAPLRRFPAFAALAALALAYIPAIGPAEATPRVVRFQGDYAPGTIVIVKRQRTLYFMLDRGKAIRYPVAVGRRGHSWTGRTHVEGKHVTPAWAPPSIVRRWNPSLPDYIPGGAPDNPMGARALTLALPEIAIHGTTRSMRRSIGQAASFGCIRMYNEHVIDLFDRVRVGATVIALP